MNMYFRIEYLEEGDMDDKKILFAKYKRIDNYVNMKSIHSLFSFLSSYDKYKDPQIMVQRVSEQFQITVEESKEEYESWKETQDIRREEMGDDFKLHKNISETSSRMTIVRKNHLLIQLEEIKSFSEFYRLQLFIQVMLSLYQKKVKELKSYETLSYLFTTVDNENILDDESEEEEEEEEESESEEEEEEDEDGDEEEEEEELPATGAKPVAPIPTHNWSKIIQLTNFLGNKIGL